MARVLGGLVFLVVLLSAVAARAHGGDTTYIVLTPNGAGFDGSANMDLPDTEGILHVPRKDLIDGRRREVVGAYVASHLTLRGGGGVCPIEPAMDTMQFDLGIQRFSFKFVARCPATPQQLDVDFQIFLDALVYYMGIVRIEGPVKEVQLFMGSHRSASIDLSKAVPMASAPAAEEPTGSPRWSMRGLGSAVRTGVAHIWSGADHMLFLLALLMTSVVQRVGADWVPREGLRSCLVDVAKIVTGFTLTHTVTLTLAALGLLRPAARVIEPAIAASVVIAALDNLRPFLRGRKWVVASTLGLLHGFGFASALGELRMPKESLLETLFGFAVGVEVGQFIFVAAFVPLAFMLRRTRFYRRGVVGVGSAGIAALAFTWMVSRIFPGG